MATKLKFRGGVRAFFQNKWVTTYKQEHKKFLEALKKWDFFPIRVLPILSLGDGSILWTQRGVAT